MFFTSLVFNTNLVLTLWYEGYACSRAEPLRSVFPQSTMICDDALRLCSCSNDNFVDFLWKVIFFGSWTFKVSRGSQVVSRSARADQNVLIAATALMLTCNCWLTLNHYFLGRRDSRNGLCNMDFISRTILRPSSSPLLFFGCATN